MSATAEEVKIRAANSALPPITQIRAANIQHQGAVTKEQEAHNIQRHNKLKADVEAAIKLIQSAKILTDVISKQFPLLPETVKYVTRVVHLTRENDPDLRITFEESVFCAMQVVYSPAIIKELLQQGMLPNISIPMWPWVQTKGGRDRPNVPMQTTPLCRAIKIMGENTINLSEGEQRIDVSMVSSSFATIKLLLSAGATFDTTCLGTLVSSLKSLKAALLPTTKIDSEVFPYLTSLLISKATAEVANLLCSTIGETIDADKYLLSLGPFLTTVPDDAYSIALIQDRIAAACSAGYVLLEMQRTAFFTPLYSQFQTILDYYCGDEVQKLTQAGCEFARHFTPLANQTGRPLTPDLFYKIFRSTRIIPGSTEFICKFIACSTFTSISASPEYSTALGNRKKWNEEQYLTGNPDNTIRKLAHNTKMEQEQQLHRYLCTNSGAYSDQTILHLYPSAQPNHSLMSIASEVSNPQSSRRDYAPEPDRFLYLHRGLSICMAQRRYHTQYPHYLVLEEDAERNPNRHRPFRMPS